MKTSVAIDLPECLINGELTKDQWLTIEKKMVEDTHGYLKFANLLTNFELPTDFKISDPIGMKIPEARKRYVIESLIKLDLGSKMLFQKNGKPVPFEELISSTNN